MFESIMSFFKKFNKKEEKTNVNSKEAAKERLHLVLMQDRANVSADFLELMKQEIIEVIKKYIDVDENEIDVRLTNKGTADGGNGAPALYANIPIMNIKNEARKVNSKVEEAIDRQNEKSEERLEKKENVEKEEKLEPKKAEEKDTKKDKEESVKKEKNKNEKSVKEGNKKVNNIEKTKEKVKSE